MDKSQEGLTDIQKKIVLLADANGTPITGNLWLQNELFLLSDAIDEFGEKARYIPNKFGPFSVSVEHSLEQLVKLKILFMDDGRIYLTSNGKHIAKSLESEEVPAVIELLKNYKDFLNDLTMDELLCYVYSAYPEMAEKSETYLEIKSKTEGILLDMIQKERISMGRTAELLDKNIEYVMGRLKERNHPIFI